MDLAPGASVHHELAAGGKAIISISASAGSLLRFSIDKGDFVLSIAVYGSTGDKVLEYVSLDFEVVDLSFPAPIAGTYRIEILSRETAETRQFELKLQPLTAVTPTNQKDSEARQALARAEVLRAKATETAFREAIEQYDQATQIWSSSSDFATASYASLKSGDLLYDLSEYPKALERYQNAKVFAEKARDWLAQASALSGMGRVESYIGKSDLAQQHVTDALNLFKQNESSRSPTTTNAYGEALNTWAEILYSRGAFDDAQKKFAEALNVFQGDRQGEAKAHRFLGYISGTMGLLGQAEKESSRALDLYRAIGNKRGEGLALASLGLTHSFYDESKAIDLYLQAKDIFHSLGSKTDEAIALNGLGQANENLHNDLALEYYEQALKLFKDQQLIAAMPISFLKVGGMYFSKGDLDQALAYDQSCLQFSQQNSDVRTEMLARTEIARIYTAQKQYALAATEYDQVLHFYESSKDLRGQARALNAYGDFLIQMGEKQKALESFERALSLSEVIEDKELHTGTLYNLARVHLQLGSAERAQAFIERCLQESEQLRASIESPDFRASYFSGVQPYYALEIEILMQLDRLHPGQGFVTKAFLASENSRARLLRELVIASHTGTDGSPSHELVQRQRELRAQFRAQAQYRMRLSSQGKNATDIAELDRQLAQLKTEYQEVEGKLRQRLSVLSSLAEPVSLEQIQADLGDDNTILLEYSLADERSYLFLVTADSIHAYELPDRKVVEDAATEWCALITAREQGQLDSNYQAKVEAADNLLQEKGRNLSQMLLGPVADKLGNRRLLIVAEGALQNAPFEALPVPVGQTDSPTTSDREQELLVQTNEVVDEPSMSTLTMIRKAQRHRSSPAKFVAIIADPVLSRSDERVQKQSLSSGAALAATNSNSDRLVQQRSAGPTRAGALTRLVHASEEADAISAVAPWGTTLVAKGFAANRETAMSSDVSQYQIIHFATHGLFDKEHPDLSGMVFAMVDRNGANTNGLMSLQDIYSLEISAELTVLSACQTALGEDIRGEGLVGLTHAFMSAGSKSVVASLWQVDDRATAFLMAEFYRAMGKGMSPAAALRSAKLTTMHNRQWSAPYYWAGFVLQGEYENHINVDRYASMRLPVLLLLVLTLTTAAVVFYRKRQQQYSPPRPS